ncbi:MAG: hypothetical protein JST93_15910 [Acidobacteria bacterium]|nr:hypothetical protein [Acidobacteriota bacterium]
MDSHIEDVRGSDYDSAIRPPYVAEDRIHYEFTLILRIFMEQLNPPAGKQIFQAPDHNGRLWPALRWNRASWLDFTGRYTEMVLKVWDKAFLLVPPANFDGFLWPPGGKRRTLLCRLRIKIQDTADKAHARIRVVRLASPSRSSFRSNSGLYDSEDVKLTRIRWKDGVSFLHNTPAHEVGHLLGLWHSNSGGEKCSEDQGSNECYGSNLYERMNVMGGGGMLDLEDSRPWRHRIPFHTNRGRMADWKAEWASSEAQLRGLEGFEVEEKYKQPYVPPKPGLIDL